MNGSALAFFVRAFYGEIKNISNYITRRKEKSKKKAEEENGLESKRAHAHHLDLRLMP